MRNKKRRMLREKMTKRTQERVAEYVDVQIKVEQSWARAGEVLSFPPDLARQLIDRGVAEVFVDGETNL